MIPNDRCPEPEPGPESARAERETDDDAAEIRYSLTALGEAALSDASGGALFRGFGPCGALA